MELRCPHRKFGELIRPTVDEGLIEFRCPSRWCGKRKDLVVLHRFSTKTGDLVNTRRFQHPEGGNNASR